MGTTWETPSPESKTMPVVRPEAYRDSTAWMPTKNAGVLNVSNRICRVQDRAVSLETWVRQAAGILTCSAPACLILLHVAQIFRLWNKVLLDCSVRLFKNKQPLDLTWLDLTWLDLTWLDLTWLDLTWLDLAWLDLTWFARCYWRWYRERRGAHHHRTSPQETLTFIRS